MHSIGLNRRINKFKKSKFDEIPELRDKDVDELLRDFAKEGRAFNIH